jgi:hypothetical protein
MLSPAERRKVARNVAGHLLGLHLAGGVVILLVSVVALDQLAQAARGRLRRG